jgi:hypothetical protein
MKTKTKTYQVYWTCIDMIGRTIKAPNKSVAIQKYKQLIKKESRGTMHLWPKEVLEISPIAMEVE